MRKSKIFFYGNLSFIVNSLVLKVDEFCLNIIFIDFVNLVKMLTPGLIMIGWSTLVELRSTSEVRGADSMLLNNRLKYLSKL